MGNVPVYKIKFAGMFKAYYRIYWFMFGFTVILYISVLLYFFLSHWDSPGVYMNFLNICDILTFTITITH